MENAARGGTSVAVVVRDLQATLDFYTEGIGIGPFETEEVKTERATWRGRPSPARFRIARASLGPCEMELIEVTEGRPPHAEFLETHGEGMNHLNIDKLTGDGYLDTMGRLHAMGVLPFWGLPAVSFNYVESEHIGGVTFEIMRGSGHAGKKGHNHLGLVVEDTQRVIEYYGSLGVGPFRTGIYPTRNATFRDKIIDAIFKASFADIGECQLELIEVLEGNPPHASFLTSHGEGMHHFCMTVGDLEATLDELATAGIEAPWRCPEMGLAHLDTSAIGGMTFAVKES